MSKSKPWLKAKKRDHTTGNGKGDRPRPVDKEKYDANYEAIFGKRDPTYMQRSLDWVNEKHGEALKKLGDTPDEPK